MSDKSVFGTDELAYRYGLALYTGSIVPSDHMVELECTILQGVAEHTSNLHIFPPISSLTQERSVASQAGLLAMPADVWSHAPFDGTTPNPETLT